VRDRNGLVRGREGLERGCRRWLGHWCRSRQKGRSRVLPIFRRRRIYEGRNLLPLRRAETTSLNGIIWNAVYNLVRIAVGITTKFTFNAAACIRRRDHHRYPGLTWTIHRGNGRRRNRRRGVGKLGRNARFRRRRAETTSLNGIIWNAGYNLVRIAVGVTTKI
jgi:transposase